MNQYNTSNIKQSNSKLNKVNTEIKNGSKVILNLSSNVIGDDNDKTNFLNKL